jgi:hypothetical protein
MYEAAGVVTGLICAAVGAWGWLRGVWLARYGERVTGTVVGLPWSPPLLDRDSRFATGTYRAVVTFRTADGRDVRASAPAGRNPAIVIGDPVQVVYDPRRPSSARIDTLSGHGTLAWAALTAVGLVLMAVALAHLPGPSPI